MNAFGRQVFDAFVGPARSSDRPQSPEALRSFIIGGLVLMAICVAVTVGFSMANRDARHATPSIACQVEAGSAPGTLITVCSDR